MTELAEIRASRPNAVPLPADVSMAEALVSAPIDANGNLTADGTRSFEWDARNQLVAVTIGTHRSEFSYDGLQRRVRQVEKDNGVTTSDTHVLWCETAICEERAADGVTVTRRAFGLGEQISGQAQFFTTDHLGSVREVTDTAGALLARYAFDPWGRRTVTAGTDATTVGFTGHRMHTGSGLALALTLTRALTVEGPTRWLSEDALGIGPDGPNLYGYARNSPLRFFDPIGTSSAVAVANAYAVKCATSAVRNGFNRCPATEPTGDPNWERDTPGMTRALKAVGGSGTAKYRNRTGSECAYDKCGRLKPDDGSNYTYNYSPHDWSRPTTVVAHIWNDVLPHYLCFQGYVPNLTQVY